MGNVLYCYTSLCAFPTNHFVECESHRLFEVIIQAAEHLCRNDLRIGSPTMTRDRFAC